MNIYEHTMNTLWRDYNCIQNLKLELSQITHIPVYILTIK